MVSAHEIKGCLFLSSVHRIRMQFWCIESKIFAWLVGRLLSTILLTIMLSTLPSAMIRASGSRVCEPGQASWNLPSGWGTRILPATKCHPMIWSQCCALHSPCSRPEKEVGTRMHMEEVEITPDWSPDPIQWDRAHAMELSWKLRHHRDKAGHRIAFCTSQPQIRSTYCAPSLDSLEPNGYRKKKNRFSEITT